MLVLWLAGMSIASPGFADLTGDSLAPYRGQPIVSIDIEAPPEEDREELRRLLDIQPGYLLASDDVQAALKRLYALGRFADVGVTAERWSGSVSLHFYVTAIRRLDRLEIEGLERASYDGLQAALAMEPGDQVDSRTEGLVSQRALSYLHRAGFPAASVSVTSTSPVEGTPVSLVLQVREGQPARIASIHFRGRPRLHKEVLRSLMLTRPGGILDLNLLEQDAKTLRQAYRAHGFWEARVADPEVSRTGQDAQVVFEIQAQTRYYLEVIGNTRLTRDDMLRLWSEPTSSSPRDDLQAFANRIRSAYGRLGYAHAAVSIRERRDVSREAATFSLIIRAGPLQHVRSLEFVGATVIAPHLLAEQVRAVLRTTLRADTVFERSSGTDRCLSFRRALGEPRHPLASCPRLEVPPDERWIPELYEEALDEITAAYHHLGHLFAKVGPPEPRFRDNEVVVRVPVVEGPQTVIHSLAFRGNQALTAQEMLSEVETAGRDDGQGIQPGRPFSVSSLEDGRIALLRRYRDLGYLYAQVFAETERSADRTRAEVVYRVEEGPQVRVARILVRGNRHTRDSLILGRMTTAPGDLYRLEQALEDQRAISALGVFSSVRVKLIDEERPAEQKDLVAEVVERNRQPIEILLGASSAEGPRLRASYSHINLLGTASAFTGSAKVNRQVFFDLYGVYEETMRERYQRKFDVLDELEREVRVGVRSPPLTPILFDPSARLDLVHRRENAVPFSLQSLSAILGLDFRPLAKLVMGIEPQFSRTELEVVEELRANSQLASRIGRRLIQEGWRDTFKMGSVMTWDQRDDPFNPRRGWYATAKATYAIGRQQAAAAPFSFTKVEGNVSAYLPTGQAVLALSARAGVIDLLRGRVPIDERFFLGGRGTLRGFPEGGTLIAQDACPVYEGQVSKRPSCHELIVRPEDGPPLTTGGNLFALLKSELRVPLTADLAMGLFVDAGNLWIAPEALAGSPLRVTVGAGLRYSTPVGPMALDVGANTNPRTQARAERATPQLHFSVGVF